MFGLKLTNRKPKQVVYIHFGNNAYGELFPSNVRIPLIGENVYFSALKKGTVVDIYNDLEDGFFNVRIYVK